MGRFSKEKETILINENSLSVILFLQYIKLDF